jgi:hypothetical protein
LRALFRRLFQHDKWAIGLLEATPEQLLRGNLNPPQQWLCGGFGSYIADPFLFAHEGRLYLIYELFTYLKGDARIAIAEMVKESDGRYSIVGEREIFDEPFHQSYPNIFSHDGDIYCLPEQSESRGLILYRAADFPYRWDSMEVVIDNFPVVDPTLVKHEDKWWLFASRGDGDQDRALYLWHSDSPLGPWMSHTANPVKQGLGEVRPAGPLFRHEGELYRPVQAYDGRYGTGIVLYRISDLSVDAFNEVFVAKLLPYTDYPHGLHHICMVEGLAVVDGNRYASLPEVALKLLGIIRRRLSRAFG